MNMYSTYRTPGKAFPKWFMEIGAAVVFLAGIPVLIAWHCVYGRNHK